MIRTALVVIAVVAAPLAATAQPAESAALPAEPTWIVGAGVGLGGVAPAADSLDIGAVVYGEVLYRPLRSVPLYAHATYANGARSDSNAWWMARVGVEYRPCSSSRLCYLLDADVGFLHIWDLCQDDPTHPDYGCVVPVPTRNGAAFTGRAGIDAGGRHVRVRIALEMTRGFEDRFSLEQNGPQDPSRFFALELGLAATF